MIYSASKTNGFTLIELVLVIAVLSIVFSSATVVFGNMIGRNSLKYHGYQIVQNLRQQRTNTVTGKDDSDWGIYFNNVIQPYGYTLFRGNDFVGRDSTYDLTFEFPSVLRIEQMNLGGGKELYFQKSSGLPSHNGNVVLGAEGETYDISINELGLVDYGI